MFGEKLKGQAFTLRSTKKCKHQLKKCINIFDDNDNDDDDDDDDDNDNIAIAEQLTLSIFHSVETLRCFC